MFLFLQPVTLQPAASNPPSSRGMVKALTEAELAILAAGRPASRPDDFQASEKERSRYDRLVKRQRHLEAAVQPKRSSRLASKTLHVSDEWLKKNHPGLRNVQIGSPVGTSDGRHVERSISACERSRSSTGRQNHASLD